ncbi:UDP-Glycosyltransferase/glycogen phosphorylase [Earliella scabrosa]|nr:UDP-Glycosyltransferase/glycogen phosphorylase [Earliella scabrosa]
MTTTTFKHIVAFPIRMWGHSRTMCTLVARLVKLRPVIVTFFTVPSILDRVKAEIARDFLPGEESVLSRIRVISLLEAGSTGIHDTRVIESAFAKAWMKLINDEPLECVKTGTLYQPPPVQPHAAIFDIFHGQSLETVLNVGPQNVKVYNWLPIATLLIPKVNMTKDDPEPRLRAEAERRGIPFDILAKEMLRRTTGTVMQDSVNPPMHDYETQPQAWSMPAEFIGRVVIRISRNLRQSHGVITFDAAEYAPKATHFLRSWYAETGRKAFYAGPLIPQTQEDTSTDPRSRKIQTFLDEHLVSHGERSVVYVSFGSLFWPSDTAKLCAVLEVLAEQNIPFVMSCGAEFSTQSPADIQERLSQYKHAVITDWVPQHALLNHLATGWYISHGGHNSTLEAIDAGIPMILWPVTGDQPVNAIHLSETLNVAYELIQVRHGSGAGKIYRNGRTPVGTIEAVMAEMRDVLDRAFGEDGARKRKNLLALRETLRAAWAEDGVARRDVEAFLDDI